MHINYPVMDDIQTRIMNCVHFRGYRLICVVLLIFHQHHYHQSISYLLLLHAS